MTLPELLAAVAQEESLRFLLIGGHAVMAHGYVRTTFDVDFLIHHDQFEKWLESLTNLNYRLERQEGAFALFSSSSGGDNLDLMMVNGATFEGMWQGALQKKIAEQNVRIPSLDHLLALKLHVLKQNQGHRAVKDLDDVIQLVLVNRLDVGDEHYKRLFSKYGTTQLNEQVRRAVSGEEDPE
jgi:hypothetical protein